MTLIHILKRNNEGAAVAEFALVAPVLAMTLFGLFDLGHSMYTNSLLQGAIANAARNSTIQGAGTGALDAQVTSVVHQIAPNATLAFNRQSYTNFSGVRQPETFTDANSDGVCDNGEAFEDANGNGVWDADQGIAGNGGARDAVLYTVTVSYRRLFPIGQLIGQSNTTTMKAVAVLRNQPYGIQNQPAVIGYCP